MGITKIVLFLVVCMVVDSANVEKQNRVKRAKYYSYPARFYKKPPASYPVKGAFSYTPPPGYMEDDQQARPSKVRPHTGNTNNGLGDEDFNNLIKHLTKQDLNRILELAGGRFPIEGYKPYTHDNEYTKAFEENIYNIQENKPKHYATPPSGFRSHLEKETIEYAKPPGDNYDLVKEIIKPFAGKEIEYQKPVEDSIFKSGSDNLKPYPEKNAPVPSPEENIFVQYMRPAFKKDPDYAKVQDIYKVLPRSPMYPGPYASPQEVDQNTADHVSGAGIGSIDSYNSENTLNPYNIYTKAEPNHPIDFDMPEVPTDELLPAPVNMREDYQISYSNNVPVISKQSDYKTENFGDIPLMNYDSKLDSVSSYYVPHYTVISPKDTPVAKSQVQTVVKPSVQLSLPAQSGPTKYQYEAAPSADAAKQQSDAHLKATKIWAHRSKGMAYTLHDDGTLSPEGPLRSKPKYG